MKREVIYLDFESYYDSEVSLKKLSTEAYIRHPQFGVHSVALAVGDGPTRYFFGDSMKQALAICEGNVAVAHNAKFDMAILNWVFGVRPGLIVDTLSMSRALLGPALKSHSLNSVSEYLGHGLKVEGELEKTMGVRELTREQHMALAPYAKRDVHLCREVFRSFKPHFPRAEYGVVDWCMRAYVEPRLLLNQELLEEAVVNIDLDRAVVTAMFDEKRLVSNNQFADMLREYGVDPPVKISKTTGQPTYAFAKGDNEFLALLQHPNQAVRTLVSARLKLKSNIEKTRTAEYADRATRGPWPVSLEYSGAMTTHRFSGSEGNPQNLGRGGVLRDSICAPEGYSIITADFAQIELRITLCLAGEFLALGDLEDGVDLYCTLASAIFGRRITKADKRERHIGKSAILGCFGPDTQVLTNNGCKRIVDVRLTDLVWDGLEWVQHQGLLPQGEQETVEWMGVYATPDHGVLTERGWREWHEVRTSPSLSKSALYSASLPSSSGSTGAGLTSPPANAHAGGAGLSIGTASPVGRAHDAMRAQSESQAPLPKSGSSTAGLCRTISTVSDYLTAYPQSLAVAITRKMHSTIITAEGALQCMRHGVRDLVAGGSSSPILLPSKGGIPRTSTSTASTMTRGMSQAISGSPPENRTSATGAPSANCNYACNYLKLRMPVFDLAYAGPRNRFTIITEGGPLIVHNCGFGMGKDRFLEYVRNTMPDFTAEEAALAVAKYREQFAGVPRLWRQCERALDSLAGRDKSFRISQSCDLPLDTCPLTGAPSIVLPNGLRLKYPGIKRGKDGHTFESGKYGTKFIFGGALLENIAQALARIIMTTALTRVNTRYPVVHTVHDELVMLVKDEDVEEAKAFITEQMTIQPDWMPNLPLAVELNVGKTYGEAK
jgi:hypothetical protein